MARIRTIKPEFWTDEVVGECSLSARLLFLATLSFADDHGGLDRSAKQLRAQAFPYDSLDCEPLIQELLAVGLLVEYRGEDGRAYLHIKNFKKHQRIDKPSKPRVPLKEVSANGHGGLAEGSANTQRALLVGSGSGSGSGTVPVKGSSQTRARDPVDNGDNSARTARGKGRFKKPSDPKEIEKRRREAAAIADDLAAEKGIP